jgi:hypothetical protein
MIIIMCISSITSNSLSKPSSVHCRLHPHSICSPLLSYQPPILTELEAPGLVQAMWELWHRADHPIVAAEDQITPGHHFLQLHYSIAVLLQSLTKTSSRTKVCIPSTLNRSKNLVTFFLLWFPLPRSQKNYMSCPSLIQYLTILYTAPNFLQNLQ